MNEVEGEVTARLVFRWKFDWMWHGWARILFFAFWVDFSMPMIVVGLFGVSVGFGRMVVRVDPVSLSNCTRRFAKSSESLEKL